MNNERLKVNNKDDVFFKIHEYICLTYIIGLFQDLEGKV